MRLADPSGAAERRPIGTNASLELAPEGRHKKSRGGSYRRGIRTH